MIWEFGTDENPDWVHISYVNEEANRNRCLKAYRKVVKLIHGYLGTILEALEYFGAD